MKDIKGYEGLYAVTSCGKVWSYKRNNFLVASPDTDGYFRVSLYKGGKGKIGYIHRLVAEAYIPNPNNFPQVNHKTEDKSKNAVPQLEWCTCAYNNNYGTAPKRRAKSRGKRVICIETGVIYNSTIEASAAVGRTRNIVSQCCRGLAKTCAGFHWAFVV